MKEKQIEFGDEINDLISGLTGIAVARTDWMNGCSRIGIAGPAKDGIIQELQWVDITQLIIIKKGKIIISLEKDPGGPRQDPKLSNPKF